MQAPQLHNARCTDHAIRSNAVEQTLPCLKCRQATVSESGVQRLADGSSTANDERMHMYSFPAKVKQITFKVVMLGKC